RVDRGWSAASWVRYGRLDGADDRRPDRGTLWAPLPQPRGAPAAQRAGVLAPAPTEATRTGRRGGAGALAAHALSRDQKKATTCRGVVMFGDEASFWLDGSLHRTWARIGVQPRVDTFGA